MKKILFGFLTGLLFISTSWAIDAFVGGVQDQDDQPLAGVTIASLDGALVITTGALGVFELKGYHLWNDSTELEVSYPGCESRKLKLWEMNNKFTTLQCGQEIEEVVVTGCRPDLNNGIKEETMIDGVCYPSKCVEPRWKLIGSGTAAQCVLDCSITVADQYNGIAAKQAIGNECYPSMCISPRWRIENAGTTDAKCIDQIGDRCVFPNAADDFWDRVKDTKYAMRDNKFRCVVTGCESKDYKPNAEETDCVKVSGVCTPEDAHAIGDGMLKDGVCVIKECDTGWKVDTYNNICISRIGDPCEKEEYKRVHKYATSGTYQFRDGQETCINLTCDKNKGYKPNEDATNCVDILTKCTSEQKAAIPNAKSWGIEKGTENCIALECQCGYILENGRCRAREENEKKCSKYTKPQLPKNALNATMQCLNGLDGEEVCVIDDDGCAEGYDLDKAKNKCVKLKGRSCIDTLSRDDNSQIKTAKWDMVGGKLTCVVKECHSKDYKPNDANTDCVQVAGACTTDDPYADVAKKGTLKKGKCIPDACMSGYAVKDGKCILTGCKCGYIKNGNECVQRTETECDPSTSPAAPANAIKGIFECPNGEDGAEICKIRDDADCAPGYYVDRANNRCLSYDGVDCKADTEKPQDPNAREWRYIVLQGGSKECRISLCADDWDVRDSGAKCVKIAGDCTDEQKAQIPNIKAGEIRDGKCYVTECYNDFSPNRAGTVCEHNPCPCGQKLNEEKTGCVDKSDDDKKCEIKNAAEAKLECEEDKREVCRVVTCEEDFKTNANSTRCVSQKNDKCIFEGNNRERVKTARYRERNGQLECVIKACTDGWMVDEIENECVPSEGGCTETQYKDRDENATAGKLKKGKCYITQCVGGYEVSDNKCVPISGSCTPEQYNATAGVRVFDSKTNTEWCKITACAVGYDPDESGKACVVDAEEQAAKEKYEAAKENERSLENRLLGATAMGTMGVGGGMVAQSLAEQNADADAERDMAAYLATFKCDYGAGRNIRGGEYGVELPGATELIPLYAEYVALANDLKSRKAQMGLKPGIESEKILDSATTGLYDDVSTGITKGTYASLSRALSNPNGEDAKLWAAQKEETANRLKTGAITAGAGAVVSIAGNIVSTSKFNNKINKLKSISMLGDAVEKQSEPSKSCPSVAPGTWPDCNCGTSGEYNPDNNKCDRCPGDQTAQGGKCGCYDSNKPNWDSQEQACVAAPSSCTPACEAPTADNHLTVDDNCNCGCDSSDYKYLNGKCVYSAVPEIVNLASIVKNALPTLATGFDFSEFASEDTWAEFISNVELPSDVLFAFGKSELTNESKTNLANFAKNLKDTDGVTKCDISISGFTDRAGDETLNQTLSQQRADSVKDYLVTQLNKHGITNNVTAAGYGETQCFCVAGELTGQACSGKNAGDQTNGYAYKPCRKVKISAVCQTPDGDTYVTAQTCCKQWGGQWNLLHGTCNCSGASNYLNCIKCK